MFFVLFFVTDIKGSKKLFPDLPFGNADLDKAESRKGQLDTFLKVRESLIIMSYFLCGRVIS